MYWNVPRIVPSCVRLACVGSAVIPAAGRLSAGRGEGFGQAEVEQLDARLRQHDVAGLQIAMDDSLPVRLVERVGDLDGEAQRLVERKPASAEPFGERLAFEQLHDEVFGLAVVADVVEGADVRVGELRDRLRLPLEALADLGGFERCCGQDLDRDRAVEARVAGAIDLPHSARADRREDLVGAEARAGCEGHGTRGIVWRGSGPAELGVPRYRSGRQASVRHPEESSTRDPEPTRLRVVLSEAKDPELLRACRAPGSLAIARDDSSMGGREGRPYAGRR